MVTFAPFPLAGNLGSCSHLQRNGERSHDLPPTKQEPWVVPLGVREAPCCFSPSHHWCRVRNQRFRLPRHRRPFGCLPGHAQSHWRMSIIFNLCGAQANELCSPFSPLNPASHVASSVFRQSDYGHKFDNLLVDYVHPRKFPKLGPTLTWVLRATTVGVLVGVYQFNTEDIGRCPFLTYRRQSLIRNLSAFRPYRTGGKGMARLTCVAFLPSV